MNAKALTALDENSEKIYRSKHVPNFHIRAATRMDDESLGQLISEYMPSNGMILSYERKPSYLVATHTQYNRPDVRVIVPDDQPDLVVGMMNLGWKYCHINGQQDVMRYVGDLRLNAEYRGQKILRLLMDYLYDELPNDGMLQSIILNDNTVARSILHERRKGFPLPYYYDDIRTFTVSQAKKPDRYNQFQFRVLTRDQIDSANAFIIEMKEYFNFLPNYDFNALAEGQHPYWKGLKLDDFYLIRDQENKLVGIYGLWNQKSFKQTRVLDYSRPLKLMKPFYNAYAKFRGVLSLPQINGTFDYLMLHSPLCHPEHMDVFASLIFHAKEQTKQRGKETYCITLAENDPRLSWMKHTTSHILKAKHYLHSFKAKPYDKLDRSKISYFDVGRI